jgi:methanogenic corrinoid protein MtbC1
MEPVAREIRFDPAVLEAAERHACSDLSAFVNAAVRRALPHDAPPATAAECRAAFVAALDARDPHGARALVEEAVACGVPAADVYEDVLAPVLHEIGHRWAVDEISVAHEHFVTGVVQGVVSLIAAQGKRAPTGGRLAVAACTPGELHGIALQMVADLLERDGWEVIALGPSTPAEDVAALARDECADLVVLSTSTAGRLPGLAETLERLGELSPRPLVAVGGGLFTAAGADEARALGADLVESDLRAFVAAMRARFPPS